MQRFAAGFLTTLIVGFGAVWMWMHIHFLDYMDGGFSILAAKMQIAAECKTGQLVVLGDSRAVADIAPSRIGEDVVNLAIAGGAIVESYVVAKKILACPNPPRAVIISIAPSNFGIIPAYMDRAAYSGLLSYADLQDIRARTQGMRDGPYHADVREEIATRVREAGFATQFPSYYFHAVKEALLKPRAEDNRAIRKETLRLQGWYPALHGNEDGHALAEETEWRGFRPLPFCDYYMRQLLALFEERHVPVYFVGMPFNHDSIDIMHPEFMDSYTAYIQYITRLYGAQILGALFSSMPWTMCVESNHLNSKGARVYSDILRQILNEAQIEGSPYHPVEGKSWQED